MLCLQWAGLAGSAQGLCRHQLDLILTAQLQGCLSRERAHSSSQGRRREGWISEQQGGRMLHSSVPAALRICPCAATAAAHAGPCSQRCPSQTRPAQSPAPPACCRHPAHPDPPGCITAQSTPHPVRSVLHTHPNTGVKTMATPQQGLSSAWLYPPVPRQPCSSSPELAGARLPCWHPELPLAPTTDPQSRLGQPARHSLAPCLSNLAVL